MCFQGIYFFNFNHPMIDQTYDAMISISTWDMVHIVQTSLFLKGDSKF